MGKKKDQKKKDQEMKEVLRDSAHGGVTFHDKNRVWDYVFSFVNTDLDPSKFADQKEKKAAEKMLKKHGIEGKDVQKDKERREALDQDKSAVLNRLRAVGFEISHRFTPGNQHFQMYRVAAPQSKLTKWAEHIGLEKELTDAAVEERIAMRERELAASVQDEDGIVPVVKKSHIPRFEEYTVAKAREGDFKMDREGEFTSGERQRIMFTIMTSMVIITKNGSQTQWSGCGLDPISGIMTHTWGPTSKVEDPKLQERFAKFNGAIIKKKNPIQAKRPVFADCFPLHEPQLRDFLKKRWVFGMFTQCPPWKRDNDGLLPWEQPFDEIRNYLGEKIALYFAWLGFYTTWLFPLSILGGATWIIQMATSQDSPATIVYAVLLSFWATAFQEFWKRRSSALAWEWNVMDFEEEEPVRPQFKGKPRASPITGEIELYYPRKHRWGHYAVSLPALITMVLIIVTATLGLVLFKFKSKLPPADGGILGPLYKLGGPVGGISQGFLIIILNKVFKGIAEKLNEKENHRTQTEYEDALIAKIFAFQFVNSYFSLFYIAFMKNNVPMLDGTMDHCKGSCMANLTTQLSSVFIVQVVVGQFKEALIPLIKGMVKRAAVGKDTGADKMDEKAIVAAQAGLPMYDTNKDVMADYNEMIIQFGYVTMFAAAFPIASVVALLNNILEIRLDAYKILFMFKRPHYKGAEDIGTWAGILELLSWVAIITNAAIIGFTSSVLAEFGLETLGARLTFVILIEHFLFFVKFLMMAFIPDMPKRIRDELLREDFAEKEALKRQEVAGAADFEEDELVDFNDVDSD